MTHSLNLVLRCDRRVAHEGEPDKTSRCPKIYLGPPARSIEEVRELATTSGWTFQPGQPHRHIGGRDYCPDHKPGS